VRRFVQEAMRDLCTGTLIVQRSYGTISSLESGPSYLHAAIVPETLV